MATRDTTFDDSEAVSVAALPRRVLLPGGVPSPRADSTPVFVGPARPPPARADSTGAPGDSVAVAVGGGDEPAPEADNDNAGEEAARPPGGELAALAQHAAVAPPAPAAPPPASNDATFVTIDRTSYIPLSAARRLVQQLQDESQAVRRRHVAGMAAVAKRFEAIEVETRKSFAAYAEQLRSDTREEMLGLRRSALAAEAEAVELRERLAARDAEEAEARRRFEGELEALRGSAAAARAAASKEAGTLSDALRAELALAQQQLETERVRLADFVAQVERESSGAQRAAAEVHAAELRDSQEVVARLEAERVSLGERQRALEAEAAALREQLQDLEARLLQAGGAHAEAAAAASAQAASLRQAAASAATAAEAAEAKAAAVATAAAASAAEAKAAAAAAATAAAAAPAPVPPATVTATIELPASPIDRSLGGEGGEGADVGVGFGEMEAEMGPEDGAAAAATYVSPKGRILAALAEPGWLAARLAALSEHAQGVLRQGEALWAAQRKREALRAYQDEAADLEAQLPLAAETGAGAESGIADATSALHSAVVAALRDSEARIAEGLPAKAALALKLGIDAFVRGAATEAARLLALAAATASRAHPPASSAALNARAELAEARVAELELRLAQAQAQAMSQQTEAKAPQAEPEVEAGAEAEAEGGDSDGEGGGDDADKNKDKAAAVSLGTKPNPSAKPAAAASAVAASPGGAALPAAAAAKVKEQEKALKELRTKVKHLEAAAAKSAGSGAGGAGAGGKGMTEADKAAAVAAAVEKTRAALDKKFQGERDELGKDAKRDAAAAAAKLAKSVAEAEALKAQLAQTVAERDDFRRRAALAADAEKEAVSLRERAEEAKVLAQAAKLSAARIDDLERLYKEEQTQRKRFWNMIEDMKGKIRVYARARPISKTELDRGSKEVVSFPDEATIDIDTGSKGRKQFVYDHAFPPDSTQDEVFAECESLVQSAFDGYNVCVFAYGQTGSGKTHTMVGSSSMPGLTPRCVEQLFAIMAKNAAVCETTVRVYMVELYNDNLVDLLWDSHLPANRGADPPKLEIKKDDKGVITVKGVTVRDCTTPRAVLDIFDHGNGARHISATSMNATSSRSHLVFAILVETRNRLTQKSTVGKLSLVDLAGSERVSKTDATGERLKEAQAINKSLSALGNVISALSTGEKWVPYRDNKLTQLMSDSLGGNAKTLMFVNLSPVDYNADETASSLVYASRVKLITNSAEKTVESAEIKRLKALVAQLRAGHDVPAAELDVEDAGATLRSPTAGGQRGASAGGPAGAGGLGAGGRDDGDDDVGFGGDEPEPDT